MKRRLFLGGLAVIWLPVHGQARISRIGYLSLDRETSKAYSDAFREGMRALGYVEGRNVLIEMRSADGDPDRMPALARELAALRPDVLVVGNPLGVRAMRDVTADIPIVMGTMSDPVAEGFATSLARPGGNITGVVNQGEDLIPKQLQLLRELLRRASRPLLQRRTARFRAVAEESAKHLAFQMHPVYALNRTEVATAQQLLARERPDSIVDARRAWKSGSSADRRKTEAARRLSAADFFRRGRLVELRLQRQGQLSPGRRVRRPHSEGRKAR